MAEVMNVIEAAQYLKVSRQTVIRLALQGYFGRKVGARWRFRQSDLERHLDPVVVSDHSKEGSSHEQIQAGNS